MSGRRRSRRPISLIEVAVLTAPVVLGLVVAAGAAFSDFTRARQFDDWWSRTVTLRDAFAGHALAAFRTPRAMVVRQRLDPAADDAVAIRLRVSSEEWDALVADPFTSDNPWVDATVVRSGQTTDVTVRRRGDTSVHWTTPKTSFTLRAPKGERIRGFREMAVSGKAVLSAQIANSVPGEFGVSSPFTALVPVYLNERYYGLFRAVEPIDESFLRRAGWMPGDVYRADTAERGEFFKNIPRNVFVNPYIWDRVAVGTSSEAESAGSLAAWLRLVAESDFDSHQRLFDRIDRRALTGLLATTLVVGDPYHMSGVHNQFWFEDPSTGSLTPIPWDLRLLDLDSPGTNPLNDLFTAALRDPFIADDVLLAVHETAASGLFDRLNDRLALDVQRFSPHLEYERLREELVSPPGEPEEIRRVLIGNLATLDSWASDARVGFSSNAADGYHVLDFETRGFAGSDLVALRVSGANPASMRVIMDTDRDGVLGGGDEAVEATATDDLLTPAVPVSMRAAWRHVDRRFQPGRVHYRLFLTGVPVDDGVRIEPVMSNRITGTRIDAESIPEGSVLGDGRGFHQWRVSAPSGETIRLSGRTTLTEDLLLSAADTLIILPGATIELAPDVSIIARGPVFAEGNGGAPIRFVAADESLPWGAFALQGPGTNGSRIRHATFLRGGGASHERVQYKGMVTIHRASDVRLEDVVLEDNLRSDDAFNAVHSDVHLARCSIRRANGDAIDFDYSTGTIESCTIEDSRNDAIDLMTSSPLIRSNRLLGSADKGISIGEASNPVIVDNFIASGNRGIEVKDGSHPVIVHNTVTENAIGIVGEVKNWRYADGGRGTLALGRIGGNEIDLQLDARSSLSVLRNAIGTDPIDAPPNPFPQWITAAQGLMGGDARPGAVGQNASWGPPREPIWTDDFGATGRVFYEDAPNWARGGRLDLRNGNGVLTARVERGRAVWGREVDWSLPNGGELVIEVTGRDVTSFRAILTEGAGEVSIGVDVSNEPSRVGMVTLMLPPGRYSSLMFEATADEEAVQADSGSGLLERRGGRVDIRRIRVFELPGDSESPMEIGS